MARPRIFLIHGLRHSIAPIDEAFERLWPVANRSSLLDDSLSADLAIDGELTEQMHERFLTLGRYARSAGAQGILFTCSAFGPCIEAVKADLAPLPVFKPNEAMIDEAVAAGNRIGLLASFAPSLRSMPSEFPSSVKVVPCLAQGALDALASDPERHDELAAVAAGRDLRDCDLVAIAQFSLARARGRVAEATGLPVLTTPDCAVSRLRAAIEGR